MAITQACGKRGHDECKGLVLDGTECTCHCHELRAEFGDQDGLAVMEEREQQSDHADRMARAKYQTRLGF